MYRSMWRNNAVVYTMEPTDKPYYIDVLDQNKQYILWLLSAGVT